jgi:hypothetical protein
MSDAEEIRKLWNEGANLFADAQRQFRDAAKTVPENSAWTVPPKGATLVRLRGRWRLAGVLLRQAVSAILTGKAVIRIRRLKDQGG